MLQWDGRALNGAHCIAVAGDSFPMLTTLTSRPVKHKLRPCAVHCEGSWCLFCLAMRLSSTCRARPQLAHYSINTKAVTGSVSPCFISHTSHPNVNLVLLSVDFFAREWSWPYMSCPVLIWRMSCCASLFSVCLCLPLGHRQSVPDFPKIK